MESRSSNQSDILSKRSSQKHPFVAVFFNIMGAIRQPLLVLDSDLTVLKANYSFYRTFNMSPEETEGLLLHEIGNRQWDISELKELLQDILPHNSEINSFRIEHEFATLGRKILFLNARRIERKSGQVKLILLSVEDATEREDRRSALEELVKIRTVELVVAREKAEEKTKLTESALAEVLRLKEQLQLERAHLQEEIHIENNYKTIIGKSDAIKEALHKVGQIAGSNTTVLVLGETGTGKELIARALHDMSLRKKRALIKVNCATLPANLIESELFGHEKGSFTGAQAKHRGRFEIANGTTLFLDEIAELPIDLQAKLLRVVQDGEFERVGGSQTIKVDVRIIVATNRNLEKEVGNGKFREDLWYRLNVFPIIVPPLRNRPGDIPLLVAFYVKKIAKRMGKPIEVITERVMKDLQEYHWPGNIRELENVLERAVINSSGPMLCLVDDLKRTIINVSTSPKTMQAVERQHILEILEMTNWKVSGKGGASEILGLDRSTLRARMVKLGIEIA